MLFPPSTPDLRSDGKLYTREWARHNSPQLTTYVYSSTTGELTEVQYGPSMGSTNLAYQYDRLGRRTQVIDAAGTRTFGYDPLTLEPVHETFDSGLFAGLRITQTHETGSGGTLAGRWNGVQVGTAADPDAAYAATYKYDGVGRLFRVLGPGLPTGDGTNNGVTYTFLAGAATSATDLVHQTQFKNAAGTVLGWTERSFAQYHNHVTGVQNNFGSLTTFTPISTYGYGYDTLDRRTRKERGGAAYAATAPWAAHYEQYGYNDRNELTASDFFAGAFGSGTPDAAKNHDYAYDPIGNRLTYVSGAEPTTTYTRNALNQYTRTDTRNSAGSLIASQSLAYDLDGNLTEAALLADMNCDGLSDFNDIDGLILAMTSCTTYAQTYPACNCLHGDLNNDGLVNFDDINDFPAIVATGNADSVASRFVWDGENRLIEVQPFNNPPREGQKKVEFRYDYLGRRVEKKVSTWSLDIDPGPAVTPGWAVTDTRRFVWNDWLMLMEFDNSGNSLRKYTWGLDLAGQSGNPSASGLSAAGGIGGLLAVEDANGTTAPGSGPGGNPLADDLSYIYFHDANGNVGQTVNLAAGSVADAGGRRGWIRNRSGASDHRRMESTRCAPPKTAVAAESHADAIAVSMAPGSGTR